jgi:RNA polymerase sigma factor (sigma-70 family)
VNDDERFTVIFETHHHHVSAYVRRRVPPSVAPDIVAETFLAAWRHLNQMGDHSLAWLYRAAALEIAHCRRVAKRDEELWQRATRAPWSWVEDDPAEYVVGRESWATAFGSLAESDREVLRLVAWENLTPHEAAKVLGCTVVAFRVRLHRARRRLTALTTQGTTSSMRPVPGVLERKAQP